MTRTKVISTQKDLNSLTDNLRDVEAIAVETEYHGERRYWPDRFLIPITDSTGPVAIDPMEIAIYLRSAGFLSPNHLLRLARVLGRSEDRIDYENHAENGRTDVDVIIYIGEDMVTH